MLPLNLEELAIAIAKQPGKTSMPTIEDDMETDLRKLLMSLFGPMLKLEGDGPDGIVHLVHQ